jgi:hypothetical protein
MNQQSALHNAISQYYNSKVPFGGLHRAAASSSRPVPIPSPAVHTTGDEQGGRDGTHTLAHHASVTASNLATDLANEPPPES